MDARFQPLKAYYKTIIPHLTEAEWDKIEQTLTVRNLKKREYLVKEGMVCNQVSFIIKGLVRMYFVVDGRECILGFCNENRYISDYQSFLTRKPAQVFLQVLEDTEVVETHFDALQEHYRTLPQANILGRLIAESLFLMVFDGELANAKDSIEARYNRIVEETPWLLQRVPQYMIASYLGITPEALSRIKARNRKVKSLQPASILDPGQ